MAGIQGDSFLDVPTLSQSPYIGSGWLAGLMFFEENMGFIS